MPFVEERSEVEIPLSNFRLKNGEYDSWVAASVNQL